MTPSRRAAETARKCAAESIGMDPVLFKGKLAAIIHMLEMLESNNDPMRIYGREAKIILAALGVKNEKLG